MPKGFMGKVLWIDLSHRTVREETLDEAVYRQYLGGYGLGVRLLYDRMRPGVDPLGPENILGFVPGLLTGTGSPFSGRFSVVCKSPLTGGWGDANCGGFFGPELRRCGYDALFVTGASAAPVYLTLHKGEVAFHEAGDLWGTDAPSCEAELKGRHGDKWQVASIGQAGENLSLISGIVNDRGRLAARSGVGAVMGSKRLKAIALKGHLPVSKADLDAFKASTQQVMARMHPMEPDPPSLIYKLFSRVPRLLGKWSGRFLKLMKIPHPTVVWAMANQGTASLLSSSTEAGDTPIKNWTGVSMRDFPFEKARKIGDVNATQFNTKFYACSACPLHCGAEVKIDDPEFHIEEGHRVEYESLAGLGANLLIDDAKAVQYGHHLCNLYGLDVISTSAVIAFAFEAYERGLIHDEHTGGVPLRWGDPKGMLALIHLIARRQHIGAFLADGVKRAAAKIGRGAESFAMHVGGQELPYHDPRFSPSYGTTYLTDPTPGRHTAGGAYVLELAYSNIPFPVKGLPRSRRYDYANKGPAHALSTKQKQVQVSLGLCEFEQVIGTFDYSLMIKGATGWEMSTDEMLLVGERIQALRQAFNCREGITPADWRLPDRAVGRPPATTGPLAGITIDIDAMTRSYYQAIGYDPESGRPLPERLQALGLADVAEELWPTAATAAAHDQPHA
ncbi:MAG: aldehyde ferredoxin oxidoreductase family protein [Bacillota bacterium]